ncbi:BrnT family toxin [Sandarakinorhabdus sp.]|uniref:BrnT family toxin n=1 Tax=Sandarakinorhabdus sp. TaxID=1916663 RepID=UPI003F6F5633
MQVVQGFDWDAGNRDKCRKHGVSTDEIEAIFRGPHHLFPDPAHSTAETRYLAIGIAGSGRHVFVAFTLRQGEQGQLIRPISARYMHAREIVHYEDAVARAGQ